MASSAPDAAAAPQDGALEALIRRDRAVTLMGLVLLCALAWAYLARGAGLDMDGMAMAPRAWDLALWALMIAMWWVMMIAMMVPAAAPTILLYARVHRHAIARDDAARLAPTGAFAAGYLLVWLAVSIAAAALCWGLERIAAVSPMGMALRSREVAGALLIAVGLYQLSPLKQACLAHCRAPAAFLARHWRPHASGALRLGAMHGLFCVGCCGLLMALLFVGGVMDLAWIAALTVLVMIEKLLPASRWLGPASAAILIGWGAATLIA